MRFAVTALPTPRSLFRLAIVAACLAAPFAPAHAQSFAVQPEALRSAIRERRDRVEEFKFLREWGTRHGCAIYAAGGTAAGLADYVRNDLEREWLNERGLPPRFVESRFGYDYYDLYRSTQDADLVIDLPAGDADAHEALALALERDVAAQFPHTQGSKSVWEVRFLRFNRHPGQGAGEKDALLDNPDFQEQNTDSHSTGLIELTDTHPEAIVRDALDWANTREPQFLRDVADGELHFYVHPNHGRTKRARAGLNPPILSVIRYFTKAFQYGRRVRPEDEPALRAIIAAFDPHAKEYRDGYVRNQIEKNGLKLFWHARDVEEAWDTLERFGLRQKLVAFGDAKRAGTMSAWLNREPLRTKPVGQGRKRTAREVFAEQGVTDPAAMIVTHETSDFLAFESILRSVYGVPNVFQSREGFPGENALLGDGFYSRIGREGGRQNGISIRFRVDPNAREGSDFSVSGDVLLFTNRAALKVIDESIDLDPETYFRFLFEQKADANDRGIWEKLSRKVRARTLRLENADEASLAAFVIARARELRLLASPTTWIEMNTLRDSPARAAKLAYDQSFPEFAFREWFRTPLSRRYPEVVAALHAKENHHVTVFLVQTVIGDRDWPLDERWVDELLASAKFDSWLVPTLVARDAFRARPDWFRTLIARYPPETYLGSALFAAPAALEHLEWAESVFARPQELAAPGAYNIAAKWIRDGLGAATQWAHRSDWIERLLAFYNPAIDQALAFSLLTQPHWRQNPDWPKWVETLLARQALGSALVPVAAAAIDAHPEWMAELLRRADRAIDMAIIAQVLTNAASAVHPEWLRTILSRDYFVGTGRQRRQDYVFPPHQVSSGTPGFGKTVDQFLDEFVLNQPHWRDHPLLKGMLGDATPTAKHLRRAWLEGKKAQGRCESLLQSWRKR